MPTIAPSTPFGQGDVYSHCRGDWQIVLTEQNLLGSLFYFDRSTIAPPPPCWRELVARAYYCAIYPLWGRGMFIYIVGAISKSPSRNKTFQPLFILSPCWRELVARAYYCTTSPLWGRGMFIHIVGAICQSPSRNKTSQPTSFYFYRSTIAPPPPFEGSPRAGAAEYVLRGDVYSHCKSPLRNKTSRTASFYFYRSTIASPPPF